MATTAAPPGPDDRLDSWKEIAAYLKRGVRTVQRWERTNGLPVHRLELDRQGSVFAYRQELDAWWASRRQSVAQCDEIWSFIQKKEKQCGPGDDPNFGDAYCFVAIERHSKLVLNFALGKRDQAVTDIFIEGLRHATASQNFQITTDGFKPYVSAIENTLSDRVDFAQLIKVYRASVAGEARYSPAEVVSTEVVPVIGDPEPKRICTSHVERQNLTMRMQIRRFTRLTNGFSKKFENHWAALALYLAYYNFCRIHSSIRVTPAMEAKITDRVWDLAELLG